MADNRTPDDWIVKTTPEGRPYYINKKEKKSYWNMPECLKSVTPAVIPAAAPVAQTKSEWIEQKTTDGKVFYFNPVLRKSVWTKPVELVEAEKAQAEAQQQTGAVVSEVVADGLDHKPNQAPKEEIVVPQKVSPIPIIEQHQTSTAQEGEVTFQLELNDVEIEEEEEPEQATDEAGKPKQDQENKGNEVNFEDGKKIFLALMKEKGVNTSMKWNQVHDLLKKEERYKALPKISDKKKVYGDYLIQLKKNEKLQAKQKHEQARTDFRIMLSEFKEMRSDTKYTKIVQIIYNDPRFKAIDMKDREMLFQDYLDELLEREKNEYFAKRKQMVLKMKEHFTELGSIITTDTKWDEAVNLLKHNAVWNELPDVDKLEAFTEYITSQEKAESDAKRQKRLEEERKRRIEFRAYLRHKITKDEFTFKTKWRNFVKDNQENPILLAMFKNASGSTAREIFHDARQKLLDKNKDLKEDFKKLLLRAGATLNPSMSVLEFEAELRKHPEFANFSNHDCNSLEFYAAYLLDKFALRVKHVKEKYFKTIPKVCPEFSLETTVAEVDQKIMQQRPELKEYLDCLTSEDRAQILEDIFTQMRNKKPLEQIFPELARKKNKPDGDQGKDETSALKKRPAIEAKKRDSEGRKKGVDKQHGRESAESSGSKRKKQKDGSRKSGSKHGKSHKEESSEAEGEGAPKAEDGFEEGEVVDLPNDVKRQLQKTQKHKRRGSSGSRESRSGSSTKHKGHRN